MYKLKIKKVSFYTDTQDTELVQDLMSKATWTATS